MNPSEFAARYWGAQPIPVQELSGMETFSTERTARAIELSKLGYLIDMDIMAYGMDPYHTMLWRERYGYTWVPSIGQEPIPVAPGIVFPGQLIYDANTPPKGSIRVSANIDDYQPIEPPVEPEVVPGVPAEPLWSQAFGDWAPVQPLDNSPNGTVYNGPKGHWAKHIIVTPFGKSGWWSKIG